MKINLQAGRNTLKAAGAATWNLIDFLKKSLRKKSWMANWNDRTFGFNY